ncbi:hypothetical protein OS670_19900 [Pseudomonadaceae bacterium T75]|nr:hypothetical protein OS670_19900 [Pseudomonadaceae bacterium T75]
MKTIHPAIAEHVMEENEKLRGLLRTAWRLRPDHDYHDEHMQAEQKAWEVETAEVLNAADALPQQAEPTDAFTAVDMATAAAQGFRDGQAAVEPAPAQDERETIIVNLQRECARLGALTNELEQRLATRPAQTEQQPSAAQQILDLIMEECRYWHGRDEARRGNFASLYAAAKELAGNAAPIAQTAPQPEQSGLVEAVTPEIIDWVRCGLSVNGRLVDGTHPALEKLCAAYRAALSSTPSHAKRGDA